jgi:hypothetical protein
MSAPFDGRPLRADVANRAPHARKHGTTFSETWTSADGATVVAVGAVASGKDRVAVADLLRTGARALVTSRAALGVALRALDRVVQNHARENRDDELAASIVLLAFSHDAHDVEVAGAGAAPLHLTLIDGAGATRALHGHAAALGTGIEPDDLVQRIHMRRDDLLVAATVPIEDGWWPAGERSAESLLHRSGSHEASAAVVTIV